MVDRSWETSLCYAAWSDNVERLRELLDSGVSPDDAVNGKTALMEAADEVEAFFDATRTEMLSLLIDRGSDVFARDQDGQTALHYAAGAGDKAVGLLLDARADIDARANDGATALHRAVGRCCISAVQALVGRGADVTIRDSHGTTARDWWLADTSPWTDAETALLTVLLP